jgi:hypothetical protein
MKTGSLMCVLVGEAGRDGGGELHKALGSATVGSILGAFAQVAMMMRVYAECVGKNARSRDVSESCDRWPKRFKQRSGCGRCKWVSVVN